MSARARGREEEEEEEGLGLRESPMELPGREFVWIYFMRLRVGVMRLFREFFND